MSVTTARSEPTRSVETRPVELLAPAGDWECVEAAIENGADAIYFGLDCGFNARHRAKNFGISDLQPLTRMLRRRHVRGYVTLNTLVFPDELKRLTTVIEKIAEAGIDAVLVQDFGVARLVRQICGELEIHASTQMSLTSAETIEVAGSLGLARVVLARELSLAEIRKITAATRMPVEVFIHGALCVAYSGQCLTSESLGGRSANRGQCAQACRLPYDLICDGEHKDLDDVRYLLSPQDLAGYPLIPELIEAGVASLKIEGRLKTPEYVANVTAHYRRAIEQAYRDGVVSISPRQRQEMELSFSRGFSPGWLEGNDHKRLVPGRQSDKRGIELGSIDAIVGAEIELRVAAPLSLGDGLAIHDRRADQPQGGRVYSLKDSQGNRCRKLASGQSGWIGFGRGEIDWKAVEPGAVVFKNDDPHLNRRLRSSYRGADPQARQRLNLEVTAKVGGPLVVSGWLSEVGRSDRRLKVERRSQQVLEVARNRPVDEPLLREKLGRLGGTPFELGEFKAVIEGGPMVPMQIMNQLRRELVSGLLAAVESPPVRKVDPEAGRRLLRSGDTGVESVGSAKPAAPAGLTVLCRTLEQLEAVASSDQRAELVYADFHDIREYREAVQVARRHGIPIALATVRMQKPGEMGLLRAIAKQGADAILVRNLAALAFFKRSGLPLIADFSLNAANQLSVDWLRSLGAERITASYDLNRDQLSQLVASTVAADLEVVVHQHMPMFHMEHCVFCSVLSPGTNKTNCGRPCDHHVVKLRDRVGAEHHLQADVACRNTLFNATPQSGAEMVSKLRVAGVHWFRVELLDQDREQTLRTVALHRQLIAGEIRGREVWQALQAANRLGVTRGTLESKRNPLAII